jgi:hypothetical protein
MSVDNRPVVADRDRKLVERYDVHAVAYQELCQFVLKAVNSRMLSPLASVGCMLPILGRQPAIRN